MNQKRKPLPQPASDDASMAVVVGVPCSAPLDAEAFAEGLETSFPTVFKGTPAHAGMRLAEFFAAHIRSPNTRAAYLQAVGQFLESAEAKNLALKDLNPFRIAAYVETLPKRASKPILRGRQSRKGKHFTITVNRTHLSKPSIKQHLAAIRMLVSVSMPRGGIRFLHSPVSAG